MTVFDELRERYKSSDEPFLISRTAELRPTDVLQRDYELARAVRSGDVVCLVGDFDARSIQRLLTLIDCGAIVAPLSKDTATQHDYFVEACGADLYVDGDEIRRIRNVQSDHAFLGELRRRGHPGLILFSSGSTGLPKAILHDFEAFLTRFRTPRPTFRTLSFLLFDHIGGINTLLHTLYNRGVIISPSGRQVSAIMRDIVDFQVELLPTTPTFLRMMLLSGELRPEALGPLSVITYGTERMDQPSLTRLAEALPHIDFRQTFGMSELGILRVKSAARDSLWMFVGGEGVETKVVDGVLKIRAANRMLGYLNAPSPFDEEGWYDTKDVVECREDGAIRVVGRLSDWINVGGEKVLPEVIERSALEHEEVLHAKARGVDNPITGQHIELDCDFVVGSSMTAQALRKWLTSRLPPAYRPQRINVGGINVTHRFKKI